MREEFALAKLAEDKKRIKREKKEEKRREEENKAISAQLPKLAIAVNACSPFISTPHDATTVESNLVNPLGLILHKGDEQNKKPEMKLVVAVS